MSKIKFGNVLISLIAIVTAVSPFLADWNETHIYNPNWTGHAKFHNAQTMSFGVLCGFLALVFLWRHKGDQYTQLVVGTIFAGLYWIAQSMAALFPGVVFVDPEFVERNTFIILGVKTNQVMLDFFFFLLLAIGFYLQWMWLNRNAQIPDQNINAPLTNAEQSL